LQTAVSTPEKLEMHQKCSWLDLCPGPYWGSLQYSPGPVAGLQGPLCGAERNGRNGERRKEEREELCNDGQLTEIF